MQRFCKPKIIGSIPIGGSEDDLRKTGAPVLSQTDREMELSTSVSSSLILVEPLGTPPCSSVRCRSPVNLSPLEREWSERTRGFESHSHRKWPPTVASKRVKIPSVSNLEGYSSGLRGLFAKQVGPSDSGARVRISHLPPTNQKERCKRDS